MDYSEQSAAEQDFQPQSAVLAHLETEVLGLLEHQPFQPTTRTSLNGSLISAVYSQEVHP